jgi:hypothetical protein
MSRVSLNLPSSLNANLSINLRIPMLLGRYLLTEALDPGFVVRLLQPPWQVFCFRPPGV